MAGHRLSPRMGGTVHSDPKDLEGTAHARMVLTPEDVRSIDRTGGTILHTSRTNPSRIHPKDLPDFHGLKAPSPDAEKVDITEHVLEVLAALEIDVLIAIGGDDTLSYASRIHNEGMQTLCIPKTMDNDVFGTDYCIGFSTCVTRSVELINRLRTSAGSHERMLVVEMFGRNCGLTALMAGYLADVDRTLIAEVPFDLDKLAGLMMEDRARAASRYAIAVVSEGASATGEDIIESGPADAYGHRKLGGISIRVGEQLKARTGVNVMVQTRLPVALGRARRGRPHGAENYGTLAVRLIEEGTTGVMVAVENGCYTTKPADISTKGKRRVDVDTMYDAESYRPRIAALRGEPMLLR